MAATHDRLTLPVLDAVQYSSHAARVLTLCLSNRYQVALEFGKVAEQGQPNLSADAHLIANPMIF